MSDCEEGLGKDLIGQSQRVFHILINGADPEEIKASGR